MNSKEIIARRIAKEFKDGMVANLGFGIPNMAADYLPEGMEIILQCENGALKFGATPSIGEADPDLANSGGAPITLLPGASTFEMDLSFAIIRGGHVDITVLGALEVDQEGNIANWNIPGIFAPGMGGAMDLLAGAKYVIAALSHSDKKGNPKVLKKCTLPLSAKKCVDLIITDKAVMKVTDKGLVLMEVAPDVTVDEVVKTTEADLLIADDVKKWKYNMLIY